MALYETITWKMLSFVSENVTSRGSATSCGNSTSRGNNSWHTVEIPYLFVWKKDFQERIRQATCEILSGSMRVHMCKNEIVVLQYRILVIVIVLHMYMRMYREL